jgi:hypothetical protein
VANAIDSRTADAELLGDHRFADPIRKKRADTANVGLGEFRGGAFASAWERAVASAVCQVLNVRFP